MNVNYFIGYLIATWRFAVILNLVEMVIFALFNLFFGHSFRFGVDKGGTV